MQQFEMQVLLTKKEARFSVINLKIPFQQRSQEKKVFLGFRRVLNCSLLRNTCFSGGRGKYVLLYQTYNILLFNKKMNVYFSKNGLPLSVILVHFCKKKKKKIVFHLVLVCSSSISYPTKKCTISVTVGDRLILLG